MLVGNGRLKASPIQNLKFFEMFHRDLLLDYVADFLAVFLFL